MQNKKIKIFFKKMTPHHLQPPNGGRGLRARPRLGAAVHGWKRARDVLFAEVLGRRVLFAEVWGETRAAVRGCTWAIIWEYRLLRYDR